MWNEDFTKKANAIKLIIFDIDGVFTDGRIYMDHQGIELKVFHVLDGQGIKFLQRSPIHIAIISGRESQAVTARMKELGIQHVYQKQTNKIMTYENLLKELKLNDHEVAMIGDDLPDLPLLKRVGLAITVPNAVKEVLAFTSYVTQHKGGKGAVREVCEALLKARGEWDTIVYEFTSNG